MMYSINLLTESRLSVRHDFNIAGKKERNERTTPTIELRRKPVENSHVAFENLAELIYLVRATPASLIRKRPGGASSFFSNDVLTRGFFVFT